MLRNQANADLCTTDAARAFAAKTVNVVKVEGLASLFRTSPANLIRVGFVDRKRCRNLTHLGMQEDLAESLSNYSRFVPALFSQISSLVSISAIYVFGPASASSSSLSSLPSARAFSTAPGSVYQT